MDFHSLCSRLDDFLERIPPSLDSNDSRIQFLSSIKDFNKTLSEINFASLSEDQNFIIKTKLGLLDKAFDFHLMNI